MGFIKRDSSELDGVYLEYSPDYLGKHQAHFKDLVNKCHVGLWHVDPDDIATHQTLVDAGVSFVNTDLPKTFAGSGLD